MDEKSLHILEFPKIREILAGHTSFSASRELALALKPAPDPESVSLLLRQSAEARHLLSMQPYISLRDVLDVREVVGKAAKGLMLESQDLANIRTTLNEARHLRAGIEKLSKQLPSLWHIAEQIIDLPDLEQNIGKCIGPAGEVLASASAKLANLRYHAKRIRQRLLDRLQAIIDSPAGQSFIQEPIITEREGRYVILIKIEMRHEVKGIVHDISGSGATVFTEPFVTVELGNELRELVIEEKREVERILAELSAEVGANQGSISQNVALLAELDLALAKARYAQKAKAVEPLISNPDRDGRAGDGSGAGLLRLVNARHPLLKEKVVPLSVETGRDFCVLVVTGPNTGGKTVALKTIGLLTLMAQAGMPIPASEASCIPIFDGVFADIGDEQSIEQTLSTFSWHVGNIVRIIRNSTSHSLVLLDELGTSTDPEEGAALARAILLHFVSRGTMAVATTHFGDLKVFAHSTPGLENASLDFDPVSLMPTYHLSMGVPGGSNAIAVALQLGLPADIVDVARDMLGKGTGEMETLLGDLLDEKQQISALRRELESEKAGAENARRQLDDELQRLRDQETGMLQQARDRLSQETAQLEKQVRQAASDLRKVKSKEKIEQARQALAAMRLELAGQKWQTAGDAAKEAAGAAENIAPGDQVWLKNMRLWGTVLSLAEGGSQVDVQVGHSRLRLGLSHIRKTGASEEEAAPAFPMVARRPGGQSASLELDLRGKRADEVVPELDTYLNDVFLSQLGQVRIIHGFGTGTVRQIVRDTLASHPLVKSFRYGEKVEGGDGVTVVEL